MGLTCAPGVCYPGRMKRLHVMLSVLQFQRLKAIAVKTGLSVSEHVRRAIDKYLGGWTHGPD